MTTNAPDDTDELKATAENPPTPESHPRTDAPDDPTRLERRDAFDDELGKNANKHRTDGGSPDANPESDASDDGFQRLMPDDSDTDNDGRTGIFSTRREIHTAIAGFGAGVAAEQIGIEALVGIIGAALGLDGANRLTNVVTEEVRNEPWYFIVCVAIGYFVAARTNVLADIGLGMGV